MLGYFELPEDDVPDELIWHHDERLKDWFDAVKDRRGNPSASHEPMETVPMTSNELAKEVER